MTTAPPADFHVDEALVSRLVAAQHPEFAGEVRLVASGWDNAMFRLGEAWAVRMPRRAVAIGLMRNEQRWLGGFAARLPVPIPAPVRMGLPDSALGYEAPWSIVPWLDGRSALEIDIAARSDAAPALAAFVAALGVPAPDDAPANPYRGVRLAARDADVRARLAREWMRDAPRLESVWERALVAPVWSGPALWLHGDLHPANLLLDADGALAGVVDFGDLGSGDPATDLATAWLTFDERGRRIFRTEVERRRPTDAATWDRARGWALVIGSAVVDVTDPESSFGRFGARALEQVLLD